MRTAFLFSGQGAQYPGMIRDLYDSIPEVRDVFQTADEVLGRSITKLCFEGTQDELNSTHNTQPCVLAADLAAYKAAGSNGISPCAVAGFSLGEYAALVAAGVLTMGDAFRVVQIRADAMQDAVPIGLGGMAAVMKCDEDTVRALCDAVDGYVEAVNFNCLGQIVVSGEISAIDALMEKAKQEKIRAVKLQVSAPFHSKLMQPAAEKLQELFESIPFYAPQFPVYMNVDATCSDDPNEIKVKLVRQAMRPVLWEQTLLAMRADGLDAFIEIGPGKTLSGFVKKTLPDILVGNIESLETLAACKQTWS